VVAGLVIPDHICLDRSGQVRECTPGYKTVAIRPAPGGGTEEQKLAPELVERLCLDDDQLLALNRLAVRCEEVYGPGRDVEWAFADGTLVLLQCRAITQAGS
jgi:pyruvate,water dikinase